MKKTILLLTAITAMLVSCSKSDDNDNTNNNGNLATTYENMQGLWKLTSVVQVDGSVLPFIPPCPAHPDYAEFFDVNKITFHYWTPVCDPPLTDSCNNYALGLNRISSCNDRLDGKIEYLTATEMRINYEETRFFGLADYNMGNATGIILTRL